MRNAFAKTLTDLASSDSSVMLFYADIGNRLFDQLKAIAAQRAVNAGIAEANMASMAAGAAMMGFRPFIYTIASFTTARNFEQIKVDIAYQNQPVVIVGTGAGLGYANLGPTHQTFEDIALMRSLPNMAVVCPCDAYELEALMPQLLDHSGPVYFRIGKKGEPAIHRDSPVIRFGEATVLQSGESVAILSTGTIMPLAQALYDELKARGMQPELVSFHTVKPLDTDYLMHASKKFDRLITLEEHNVGGGFGSAVLEWYNDRQIMMPVHRFGIPDRFIDQVGSVQDARNKAGLTVEAVLTALEVYLAP